MASPDPVISSIVERAAKKPTARAILLDQLIEYHAESLNRSEDASDELIRERLQDLSDRVLGRVSKLKTLTKRSLERATAEVQQLVGESYQEVGKEIVTLSGAAAATTHKAIRKALREAEVSIGSDFDVLSPSQLKEIVSAPIFGWRIPEWSEWHALKSGMEMDREMRAGYFAGESMAEIVQRLADVVDPEESKAAGDLRTLARTAVQTVANNAAEATYVANSDILSGMQVVATLDSSTCPQCGARDGEIIGFKSTRTRPPFHPRCRCYLAPQVKAGLLPGLNPKPPTWSEWISGKFGGRNERQVNERQEKVLGPTIAGLLQKKRISPSDLIKRDGSRRTVAEVVAVANRTKDRKAA